MRVLMTAHPGWGHLHSMVPLALALEAAEHDVRVATAASLVPALERLGLHAVPAGRDWQLSEAERVMPGFLRGRAAGQVRTLARLAGQGMVDDLLALAESWCPDVVVRDAYELGGLVTARRLGVPLVVHGITVPIPPALLRHAAGAAIDTLREGYGLHADPELRDAYADLWMSFFPASFGPPEWPGPATERHLRPLLFDRSGDETVPEWVDALERPIVYVTLGTVFNRRRVVFERIVEALRDEPVDVIVTLGRGADITELGPLPANVHAATYIPQSLLLDRVSAVVTHGGFNTIMAALSFGVPVCCIPLSTDHPLNAQRCVELGVGAACTTRAPADGPPFARAEELTSEMIRSCVTRVLGDPAHRVAAGRMRREIEALPGVDEAVRLIEELVS